MQIDEVATEQLTAPNPSTLLEPLAVLDTITHSLSCGGRIRTWCSWRLTSLPWSSRSLLAAHLQRTSPRGPSC